MKRTLSLLVTASIFLIVFFLHTPLVHAAASVSLSPGIAQATLNGNATFSVRVNTNGEAANAFDITVSGADGATITSASKSGSLCTLWVRDPSVSGNTARFTCGLPNPGFNGSGTVGTVSVKGTALGTHTISITSAQVLANDGAGTNITGPTSDAQLKVNPPAAAVPSISSLSHPNQDAWYNNRTVEIAWTAANSSGVSYTITQSPTTTPDTTVDTTQGTFSATVDTDGVWFIHIRSFSGGQWSDTGHFRLQVDTVGPTDLVITSDPLGHITIIPKILFNAQDSTSSIVKYEMSFNGADWIEVTSPYTPEFAQDGDNIVKVRAYDSAGNMLENGYVFEIDGPDAPEITYPKNRTLIGVNQPIVITGSTQPNSKVYLYIRDELIGETTSDTEGKFEYTYSKLLAPGTYALSARVLENNIYSNSSEIIRFEISANIVQIGPWLFKSMTLIYGLIFIAILLLLFVLLLLLNKKYKQEREEKVHAEINDFVKNDIGIVRRLLYRLYAGNYQKKQEVSDSVSTISNKLEKIERAVKDSLDGEDEPFK